MCLLLFPRQFILPHSRGSSHGQTRITRKAYDHDFYIRMMEDNYELWAQLERESGVKLFRWAVGSKNPIRWKVAKTSPERNDLSHARLCAYVKKNKKFSICQSHKCMTWPITSCWHHWDAPCVFESGAGIYIYIFYFSTLQFAKVKKEMCFSKRWHRQ